jgi:DNA-binding MarR family transcriptional regulator
VLDNTASSADVLALLDDVRLLFHRAAHTTEQLHAAEGVSASERAVLELLHRTGAGSVADLARRRGVSRQHIQTLVNGLLERGLVAARDNPAHRRSPLILLTPAGGTLIDRMTAREERYLDDARPRVLARDVETARRVLATLHDAIGAAREPS